VSSKSVTCTLAGVPKKVESIAPSEESEEDKFISQCARVVQSTQHFDRNFCVTSPPLRKGTRQCQLTEDQHGAARSLLIQRCCGSPAPPTLAFLPLPNSMTCWCGQQNAKTVSEGAVSCELSSCSVSLEMSCASCLLQLARNEFARLCRYLKHDRQQG